MKQIIIVSASNTGGEKIKQICEILGIPFDNGEINGVLSDIKKKIYRGEVRNMAGVEEDYAEKLRRVIRKDNDYGIYMPENIETITLLAKFVKNPVYLIVFRNFVDVAMERLPKEFMVGELMNELDRAWKEQEMIKLFLDNNFKSALLLSYERMVADPEKTINDVAQILEMEITEEQKTKIREVL